MAGEHKQQAAALLAPDYLDAIGDEEERALREALIHAVLHVAEQLERLNDRFDLWTNQHHS